MLQVLDLNDGGLAQPFGAEGGDGHRGLLLQLIDAPGLDHHRFKLDRPALAGRGGIGRGGRGLGRRGLGGRRLRKDQASQNARRGGPEPD